MSEKKKIDFARGCENKIEEFEKLFKELKNLVGELKFPANSEALPSYDCLNKGSLEKGKKYIYIIFWTSDDSAEKISDDFDKIKTKKHKNICFPLNNFDKNNESEKNCINDNKVLYVGSSKDLRKRLEQHFTAVNPKTYALHLSAWEKNLKCKVAYIDVTEILKNYDDYILVMLEDIVASIYKPLLGKRGPNTK